MMTFYKIVKCLSIIIPGIVLLSAFYLFFIKKNNMTKKDLIKKVIVRVILAFVLFIILCLVGIYIFDKYDLGCNPPLKKTCTETGCFCG